MRHPDWKSYQDHDGRLLHVYGPRQWHDETFLVGNRAALEAVRAAVDEALETGSGLALAYASDGEGFGVGVILEEDEGRWREVAMPYSDDLAREKRELEDVLTPTLSGHGAAPKVSLERWRRVPMERMVAIESRAEADEGALRGLLEETTVHDAEYVAQVIERLDGRQPDDGPVLVETRSTEDAVVLRDSLRELGVLAEVSRANPHHPSRRG